MTEQTYSIDQATQSGSSHTANAIRALAMDAVQAANSGHPGMPMGMADIADVLWTEFLVHNPADPLWSDRDRFVLSNGHGSMLQYALLHLAGYALSIDDLKQFRQLHSKTPGHPENGVTPGVETTTGPLGQGIGNAVGMALAEQQLAQQFNRDGHTIVDHYTYAFVGDGCLMEGVSHEVCSLAGTLGLGKLIALYDDNGISIDGPVAGWFTDNTAARFKAYGWHVIEGVDGHDAASIRAALHSAKNNSNQPSLVMCKTVIGYGSPAKAGSAGSHGAPLGENEIAATREALGWPHAAFEIPQEIYTHYDARQSGAQAQSQWTKQFAAYSDQYPQEAAEFQRRIQNQLPEQWSMKAEAIVKRCAEEAGKEVAKIATRKASEVVLNELGSVLPEMIGGSADLSGSNNTRWSGSAAVTAQSAGNYVNYGVREFGMGAIMNGLALHGGFLPYSGTFLVFSDYARNAIRMAAITKARSIYVLTHDSIGLGEDGPTHQPVEHMASLRQIPGVMLWRPCDLTETAVAWRAAIEYENGPSCLALSRQGMPAQQRDQSQLVNQTENLSQIISKGGYILRDSAQAPEIILIATGSEVQLAVAAWEQLTEQGRQVRVVSMPCTQAFDQQSAEYREQVLPNALRNRVAVEAGVTDYWRKYVGLDGEVIGIDRFGESAPAEQLFEHFGVTVARICEAAEQFTTGVVAQAAS